MCCMQVTTTTTEFRFLSDQLVSAELYYKCKLQNIHEDLFENGLYLNVLNMLFVRQMKGENIVISVTNPHTKPHTLM